VKLALVHLSAVAVRAQALGHARGHKLNRSPLEGRTRRGHLLRDRVTVAAFGNHALNGPDLALDAAQPG
jgi:hypothetical protein